MPRTSNACPILWARVLVSLGMLAAGDFLCALGSALGVVGGSCGTLRRVPVAPSARAPWVRAAPSRCIHARRARAWGPGATRTAAAQQELHSERQPAPTAVHHKNRTRSPVPVGRPSLCPRTNFAAPASARPSGAAASSPPQHTAHTRPPEAPQTCAAIARALHPAPT